MGFLDKVKERASEALEQGKDVAQAQQTKLQLRKLEGEEEQALAAFGNAAYSLWEAGSLSMSSDLGDAAQRIRDVRARVEAKRTEIAAAGASTADEAEPAEPSAEVRPTDAASTTTTDTPAGV
jgi:hypothetical protein